MVSSLSLPISINIDDAIELAPEMAHANEQLRSQRSSSSASFLPVFLQ